MPWEVAKEAIRADFGPSELDVGVFVDAMYEVKLDDFIGSTGRTAILQLDEFTEQSVASFASSLVSEIPPVRRERITAVHVLAGEYKQRLEPLVENAISLYEEATYHYWASEDYVVWRYGEQPRFPQGVDRYYATEGSFSLSFNAVAGGWRAAFAFDSADFPALESAIFEIRQVKVRFCRDARAVLIASDE